MNNLNIIREALAMVVNSRYIGMSHFKYDKVSKALAALDEIESAEPFAWCFTDVNGKPIKLTKNKSDEDLRIYTPLYAHPPLAQAEIERGTKFSDTAIAGLVELVKEVVKSHSDSESCEYQECELDPCLYCQDAAKFISLLSTNEAKVQE